MTRYEYFVAVVTVDDIVDYLDGIEVDLVYDEQDDGLVDRLVNLFGVDKIMVGKAIEAHRNYQLSLDHDDTCYSIMEQSNLGWNYEWDYVQENGNVW